MPTQLPLTPDSYGGVGVGLGVGVGVGVGVGLGVGVGVGVGIGVGGAPAPPRNRPAMTALLAAVLLAVTRTKPPAGTLTGKWIQTPCWKLVVTGTVLVVVPSVTVTDIRRPAFSQSNP